MPGACYRLTLHESLGALLSVTPLAMVSGTSVPVPGAAYTSNRRSSSTTLLEWLPRIRTSTDVLFCHLRSSITAAWRRGSIFCGTRPCAHTGHHRLIISTFSYPEQPPTSTIPKPYVASGPPTITREVSASHPSPGGLNFGLIRMRLSTFIDVRIGSAMQVTDVSVIRRTIIQTSENRKVGGPIPHPRRRCSWPST